jgi:hypothetical protein
MPTHEAQKSKMLTGHWEEKDNAWPALHSMMEIPDGKLRSQLQMADRESVKGEKGIFFDIRGGPESLRLQVSNRPLRN